VEQASIQTDVEKREVRFNLSDRKAFNENELRRVLKEERFPEMTVTTKPE
jgi:hypothetical protein